VTSSQIFLSYSGKDRFEATLLQEWLEHRFESTGLKVWTFHRDQRRDEPNVSRSLKDTIRDSAAVVFLLSPYTVEAGAAQWMELAYADAFGIPTFILLHHLSYDDVLRTERGVPPLIRQSQCTPAVQWKTMEDDLRKHLGIIDGGAGDPAPFPKGTA
jgi:TIR domain-containing protein